MNKTFIILMLALAAFSPLAANELYGFGFTFGGDVIHTASEFLGYTTTVDTSHLGLGFTGDVYIGQRLGFYAGGAFGLLTGIKADINSELLGKTTVTTDMADLQMKLYANGLLGLGAFLPLNGFDISGALGFGVNYLGLRAQGAEDPTSFISVGPGVSFGVGVPVSSGVELYANCRAIMGLVLLGTYPENFGYDISVTPSLGVRIKG